MKMVSENTTELETPLTSRSEMLPLGTEFDDTGEPTDSHTPYTSPTLRPIKSSIPLFSNSPQRRVWLVSVIASTRLTAILLPHFIQYYLSLGVKPEHFLFAIHQRVPPNNDIIGNNDTNQRNKTEKDLVVTVSHILSILSHFLIKNCRVFDGEFSEKVKWRQTLLLIDRTNVSLNDWVLEVSLFFFFFLFISFPLSISHLI
jgi:hypothetical protein